MTCTAVTARATATGRFTKKIIRQSANSVSSPPARTPIAAPAPPTAPQAASAFAFAWPWKQVVMIESAAGESIAAPRPWPARAANSAPAVPASGRGERGDGEDTEAGQEQAAAPEQVGGTAAEEQEAPEDERVARDRPADLGAAELQVLGEARQGDVHGGDVEDHHQLRDEQHEQEQPRSPARCSVAGAVSRSGCGSSCGA